MRYRVAPVLLLLWGCDAAQPPTLAPMPMTAAAETGEVRAMARTLTIPEATYPAGVSGPWNLNGFNEANTDVMRVTFTIVGWPDTPDVLFRGFLQWEGMAPTVFSVTGRQVNKDGSPKTSGSLLIGVPKAADATGGTVKGIVNKGSFWIEAAQPFTTQITAEAAVVQSKR